MKFVFFVRELTKPARVAPGTITWIEDEWFEGLKKSDPTALLDLTPHKLASSVVKACGNQELYKPQSAAGLVPCVACSKPDKTGRWMVVNPMLDCAVCSGERLVVTPVASASWRRASGAPF